MHKLRLPIAAVAGIVCLVAICAVADPAVSPRVFLLNAAALEHARSAAQKDPKAPPIHALRTRADRDLDAPLVSVMDKSETPPSGDRHDYMSLAPYWWPNPDTPNHLPYIRRDGERNPEYNAITDHRNFGSMANSAKALATAYYVLGDERYAVKAAQVLRTWFLDPKTRMNPNLQYAQAVKGRNDGRGTGLIETRGMSDVVDAIGLLAGSPAWTNADQQGMKDWFTKYLDWLQNSANGKAEAAARNNHGSFYDTQLASIALFVGDDALAKSTLETAAHKRIERQVMPDGEQPLELARTKSFSYSVFNLTALFELARLGEHVGVDLWSYDNGRLRAALDYLLPYATGDKKWTRTQIEPLNGRSLAPLLLEAAARYHDPAYRAAAEKLDPHAEDAAMFVEPSTGN
ncbi:MAG: alginate lyase family protein [Terriglobales bacterium]